MFFIVLQLTLKFNHKVMINLLLAILNLLLQMLLQLMQLIKPRFQLLTTLHTLLLPRDHRILFVIDILQGLHFLSLECFMNWNFA